MPALKLTFVTLIVSLSFSSVVDAQMGGSLVKRSDRSVELEWQHDAAPAAEYQIFYYNEGDLVPTQDKRDNPQIVQPRVPRKAGGIVTARSANILRPDLAYRVVISSGLDGPDPLHDINLRVPAFADAPRAAAPQAAGNNAMVAAQPPAAGPTVVGGSPVINVTRDPLGMRIGRASTAYGSFMRNQGLRDYLQAEGQKSLAEARKIVAEAVDLELDNWKKQVQTYFERREINMLGQMRNRELYDMKKDQTLYLKDQAAKRRYEYITRHSGNSGGTSHNLNTMLDLFVGTSLGYGVSVEDLFASNPRHGRWELTPDLLRKLKVRSQSEGGKWIEFHLDQPEVIAMNWPLFFKQPKFDNYRVTIDQLNEALSAATTTDEQAELIGQLDNVFANLSRELFAAYGRKEARAHWTSEQFLYYLQAEKFVHQKTREIRLFQENPQSAMEISRTFDPKIHGKDAGTLISWMNGNGMKFAEPRVGDKAAYQQTFNMMRELYALLGEPITQIPDQQAP